MALAHCSHCGTSFTPDNGVSVDDCPVCGRSVDCGSATMDSRNPLMTGIEELKEEIRTMPHKEFFGENLQPLVDDHSRLLSLLTPPPDAAVREAVERLSRFDYRWGRDLGTTAVRVYDLHILLRAVQAPRPDASCAAECLECDTRGGPWNVKPTDAAVREAVGEDKLNRAIKQTEAALQPVEKAYEDNPSQGVFWFQANIWHIRTLLSDLTRRLAEAEARVRELEAEVATERAKREVMESASESYRNIAIEFSDDFRDAAMKEKLFKVDRRHAMAFLDIDKAAIAATEVKS